MEAAAFNTDNLLAIAAIITAIFGGITTVYQLIAGKRDRDRAASDARRKSEEECHEKLLVVQRQAEAISDELFQLKMRRNLDDE